MAKPVSRTRADKFADLITRPSILSTGVAALASSGIIWAVPHADPKNVAAQDARNAAAAQASANTRDGMIARVEYLRGVDDDIAAMKPPIALAKRSRVADVLELNVARIEKAQNDWRAESAAGKTTLTTDVLLDRTLSASDLGKIADKAGAMPGLSLPAVAQEYDMDRLHACQTQTGADKASPDNRNAAAKKVTDCFNAPQPTLTIDVTPQSLKQDTAAAWTAAKDAPLKTKFWGAAALLATGAYVWAGRHSQKRVEREIKAEANRNRAAPG